MSEPAEQLFEGAGMGTQYLRTAACIRLTAEITEFENKFFGSDFNWSLESMQRWLRSGSLFYAAACQRTPAEYRIRALVSVLIAGAASSQRLLNGGVAEHELVPWFLEQDGAPPVFYFSSVLSDSPDHLRHVYSNLLLDVEGYLKEKGMKIYCGISVASGAIGYQHLTKNGFMPVEGPKYLGKYRFMRIDASTAKTEFWTRVLASVETGTNDSAREVEGRLRASKLARLRGLYGLAAEELD